MILYYFLTSIDGFGVIPSNSIPSSFPSATTAMNVEPDNTSSDDMNIDPSIQVLNYSKRKRSGTGTSRSSSRLKEHLNVPTIAELPPKTKSEDTDYEDL
jgi:hypothetical protein